MKNQMLPFVLGAEWIAEVLSAVQTNYQYLHLTEIWGHSKRCLQVRMPNFHRMVANMR